MVLIVDVLTLLGVGVDLLSTVVLACLTGYCESDCFGGRFYSFKHEEFGHLESKEPGKKAYGSVNSDDTASSV